MHLTSAFATPPPHTTSRQEGDNVRVDAIYNDIKRSWVAATVKLLQRANARGATRRTLDKEVLPAARVGEGRGRKGEVGLVSSGERKEGGRASAEKKKGKEERGENEGREGRTVRMLREEEAKGRAEVSTGKGRKRERELEGGGEGEGREGSPRGQAVLSRKDSYRDSHGVGGVGKEGEGERGGAQKRKKKKAGEREGAEKEGMTTTEEGAEKKGMTTTEEWGQLKEKKSREESGNTKKKKKKSRKEGAQEKEKKRKKKRSGEDGVAVSGEGGGRT
jgi:hypothetical protein